MKHSKHHNDASSAGTHDSMLPDQDEAQEGCAPALLPLSLGELLSFSVIELIAHLRQIVPIMVIPILLSFVGSLGSALFVEQSFGFTRFCVYLAIFAGKFFLFLAVISMMIQIKHGWTLTTEVAYSQSVTYAWPVFWVLFLTGLLVLGGLFFILIPGVIVSVWAIVAIPAILLDGQRGFRALNYSRELVRDMWLPVFWNVTTVILLTSSVTISLLPIPFLGVLSAFVTFPFVTISLFHLYEHLHALKKIPVETIPAESIRLMKGLVVIGGVLFPFMLFALWGVFLLVTTGIR